MELKINRDEPHINHALGIDDERAAELFNGIIDFARQDTPEKLECQRSADALVELVGKCNTMEEVVYSLLSLTFVSETVPSH